MVYDTQMQGVMLMQAFSEPKRPWRINSEIGDMRGACISGTPLLDYQRMDVALETKPKAKSRRRSRAADDTARAHHRPRTRCRRCWKALDQMDNGKKANMDLLLEVGDGGGPHLCRRNLSRSEVRLVRVADAA